MRKVKLTKRNYLGKGYFYYFKNNTTGEIVEEECTEAQYLSMGGKGGSKNNPVKDGLTFIYASGGTVKVDTPSQKLGDNEYCEFPEGMAVIVEGEFMVVEPSEIINDEITVTN